MTAGRKTQFLTRAQGMPTKMEEQLQKKIKEFIWDKKVSNSKKKGNKPNSDQRLPKNGTRQA
jgi:hypothetical protein